MAARYLGLPLRSPLVASASPLTGERDAAVRLDESGVGAIVLPSLFEEEIRAEELGLNASLEQGTEHFAEALDYFPAVPSLAGAGDRYLANLESIKSAVSVPVIGSLNASAEGGWVRYARLMADAGADALELNVYHLAADPSRSAADIEQADLAMISAVRAAISLPLAVKLSPNYTALASFAARVVEAGADGLVLFNRFYQPDLDLESFDVVPRLELSGSWELRGPLRWIAILRAQLGPDVSLAATSGIHAAPDALKVIAAGANVAMMTSALLRNGPEHVAHVAADMQAWLEEREYTSVEQLCGSASAAAVADPSAYERANYMRTLRSWSWPPGLEPWTPRGRAVTAQQPLSAAIVEEAG
ncbi:dihydroorotate dehydrogenase-like protein [soil metagenome]